jgi:hypothetical protein
MDPDPKPSSYGYRSGSSFVFTIQWKFISSQWLNIKIYINCLKILWSSRQCRGQDHDHLCQQHRTRSNQACRGHQCGRHICQLSCTLCSGILYIKPIHNKHRIPITELYHRLPNFPFCYALQCLFQCCGDASFSARSACKFWSASGS